jgi:hypothetical protein
MQPLNVSGLLSPRQSITHLYRVAFTRVVDGSQMRKIGEMGRMGERREKLLTTLPYLPHLPHLPHLPYVLRQDRNLVLSLAAAKANDDYSHYSRIDKTSAWNAEITHQFGMGNG